MSQNTASSDQEKRMALTRVYAEQLPQKIEAVQTQLQKQFEQGWEQSQGETLHRLLHSMAGTAGAIGLSQVGQSARALEQMLKEIVHGQSDLQAQGVALKAEFERLISASRETPAAVPSQLSPQTPLPAPMKVLVVDDDPVGQSLLESFLTADGQTVVIADDGLDAVARRIKTACDKQFAPLIFLSGLQDENDLALGSRAQHQP